MSDKKHKVLFVSAEVDMFAKTGGLADVAISLPKQLVSMGHDVRVVMPRYKVIESDMNYVVDFPVMIGYHKEACILRETEVPFNIDGKDISLKVYFLDNYHYYDRDGIYCYMDDAERFSFLSKATLEMLKYIDFKPDIIHCNDWHTGPLCMMLKENKDYATEEYKSIKTLFTVHNLEYQGNFPKDTLGLFGVGEEVFIPEKVELYGTFSFMKAGLVYADKINTVSKEYAKEIQTEEYGEKLEGVLQDRKEDLYGIVNGISYEIFSPLKDKNIKKNFSLENFEDKYINKKALQKEMKLPEKDCPVIGLISRLTGQKGLNLILDVIDDMLEDDIQFILLGEGDPAYEKAFKEAQRKYPDKVGVFIGFNAPLANRIYAGSDMFLMPSRFEPCGLGQLISLRYGTIPIVRETGGLADTITDYDKDNKNGNGFSFKEFSAEKMLETIKRAVKFYYDDQDKWSKLVQKALSLDYTWKNPSLEYLEIYNTIDQIKSKVKSKK